MDLDGDGRADLLSGSYACDEAPNAGLFYALHRRADGTFAAPEAVTGVDGQPLRITPGSGRDPDLYRFATRAFAVDLNGDGHLDIVAGNMHGSFALFRGQADGGFATTSTWLERNGAPLMVDRHSDPCFVDWDGDGDQDLVSGSMAGGAFLFRNVGSAIAPRFDPRETLVEPRGFDDDFELRFGDSHVRTPQNSTRVWVADVDDDGKLDLLLGDTFVVHRPGQGLGIDDARARHRDWQPRYEQAVAKDDDERLDALETEKQTFMTSANAGFVWLVHQK